MLPVASLHSYIQQTLLLPKQLTFTNYRVGQRGVKCLAPEHDGNSQKVGSTPRPPDSQPSFLTAEPQRTGIDLKRTDMTWHRSSCVVTLPLYIVQTPTDLFHVLQCFLVRADQTVCDEPDQIRLGSKMRGFDSKLVIRIKNNVSLRLIHNVPEHVMWPQLSWFEFTAFMMSLKSFYLARSGLAPPIYSEVLRGVSVWSAFWMHGSQSEQRSCII